MSSGSVNPESGIANPESRRAFVTGGTGFIGSHLVEELLRRGYEVRCLIRTEPRWLAGLPIVPVRGDIVDSPELREALAAVDVVFHVAGVTRATEWRVFEEVNVEAPLSLLEVVQRVNPTVQRVVMTSSLAAVGVCEGGTATETSPLNPVSRYGRSKARMEEELRRRLEDPDAPPVTIVRPPAVYGPREADILTFFQTVSRGIVPVVGDGRAPALTLVHVRDLVRGMVDAAEHPATRGKTYFIGTDAPHSWSEVKQAATEALGRRALTVPVPASLVLPVGFIAEMYGRITGSYPPLNREKAREIKSACKICSSARATADFGYRSQVSLREGVQETVAWYRAAGWL